MLEGGEDKRGKLSETVRGGVTRREMRSEAKRLRGSEPLSLVGTVTRKGPRS